MNYRVMQGQYVVWRDTGQTTEWKGCNRVQLLQDAVCQVVLLTNSNKLHKQQCRFTASWLIGLHHAALPKGTFVHVDVIVGTMKAPSGDSPLREILDQPLTPAWLSLYTQVTTSR